MALNNTPLKEHVCDLPYKVYEELCHLLDEHNNWEELAGAHMGFTMEKIRAIRRDSRDSTPAKRLMDLCIQRNETVYELFLNLCKMQLHQATLLLKPYVAEKYHALIKEASDAPPSELDLKLTQTWMVQNLRAERSRDFNLVNNFDSKQLCDKNKLSQLNYQKIDNLSKEADLMKFSGEQAAAATTVTQNPNKQAGNNSGETTSEFNPEIASNNNHIPYDELCLATNFWDKNNILGRGGFGTVFRGHWKKTEVAIKRIEQRKSSDRGGQHTQQVDQLYKELKFLNSLRQDNILPLYGFSLDSEQPCLVCQLMPNGSLQDRIHRKNNTAPLSWQSRLGIALGTARGLQFLHTRYEKPLIHGDIKSANILLDADWTPRIGDFGLALEGPIASYTHLTVTSIHGTRPYLPLDFLRSKQASTKVDTYSFGIVLFEIVTGLWAHEKNRKPELLRDLMQGPGDLRHHMDPNAPFDPALGPHVFQGLGTLGQQCTANLARDRPDMTSVFLDLEKLQVTEQNLPGIASASTNYTIARPERTKAPRNAGNNPYYLSPIPEQRSSLAGSASPTLYPFNVTAPTPVPQNITQSPQNISPQPNPHKLMTNSPALMTNVTPNIALSPQNISISHQNPHNLMMPNPNLTNSPQQLSPNPQHFLMAVSSTNPNTANSPHNYAVAPQQFSHNTPNSQNYRNITPNMIIPNPNISNFPQNYSLSPQQNLPTNSPNLLMSPHSNIANSSISPQQLTQNPQNLALSPNIIISNQTSYSPQNFISFSPNPPQSPPNLMIFSADSPRLLTPVPNSTQNLISFSPNLGNSPQPVVTSSESISPETSGDSTVSQEVDSVFLPATIKSMENHTEPEPSNSDSGDLPNLSILGV